MKILSKHELRSDKKNLLGNNSSFDGLVLKVFKNPECHYGDIDVIVCMEPYESEPGS